MNSKTLFLMNIYIYIYIYIFIIFFNEHIYIYIYIYTYIYIYLQKPRRAIPRHLYFLWPLYHFVLTAFLYGFSSFDVLMFFPAYFNLLFHVFLLLIRFHSVSNFLSIILTPLAPAN